MMTRLLNGLHKKGFYSLLSLIITIAYFLKGHGVVRARFHKSFRAYQYIVDNITYLSIGPGWAYSFSYLLDNLKHHYNFYYVPSKGDVVMDIGAGLGEEVSIYAQLVSPSGCVYAIEANPTTFEGLRFMCEANKFDWVKLFNIAVCEKETEVWIEDNPESYLKNTIGVEKTGMLKVQGMTLDNLVSQHKIKRIDFLKVNIEGAEQLLIQGMEDSVGLIRNLCISCHDFRNTCHGDDIFYVTREKVIRFLIAKNFHVLTRQSGIPLIDDYVYASRIS